MLTDAPLAARTHNLPHRPIPLLGREAELAQIQEQLLDPACQLLTLLGPGGMGKTRLAIEVENQLCRYLANKELLLLLDNFEHLLEEVEFLSELPLQAPGVKARITSRELLNLQEEWLFPLSGLAFPPIEFDAQSLEQYAAATLFVDRMRRLRPQFVLAEEAEAVGRICRLVEGLPLALEKL